MSAEDNVKIVQEMYSAFLQRDVPGILVHLDDDIIWIVPGSSAVPMTTSSVALIFEWWVTGYVCLGKG